MRKVTCTCESIFDAGLPEEVDMDGEDDIAGQIIGGSFFSVTCPSCGALLKPELRVRLHSKKRGIDVTLIPELERSSVYRGRANLAKGSQAVVGYTELYERMKILSDALDPDTVEIVKYYLALKAEEQVPEAEITVIYAGLDGDRLTFHLLGLKENEVAVLHIGHDIYDRSLSDKARCLRSEPFKRIFAGHYRSIRVLEADQD
jgi:hypothetical protein